VQIIGLEKHGIAKIFYESKKWHNLEKIRINI